MKIRVPYGNLKLAAENLPNIVNFLILWSWNTAVAAVDMAQRGRALSLSFQRGNDDNVCRRYDATDDYGDGMAPLGSLPLSRLSSLVPSPLVPRQPSQSYPLLLLYRAGLSNLSMHLAPPSSGTVEPLTDVRRLAPLSFRFALYQGSAVPEIKCLYWPLGDPGP